MHQRRTKGTLSEACSDKVNTYCIVLECIKLTYENCLNLRTLVTIKAKVLGFRLAFKHEMMCITLGHLAVGFLVVTRRLSAEAAGGEMDATGASCSYMMEGDFQLC